jgi:hypothetical protein
MNKLSKILIVLAIFVVGAVMVVQSVLAKPQDGTRPGWGFGDQNHVHTGPPGGPSVHPVK